MNALTASINSALDLASAHRLAHICGMFGSDHDGEVVNAARLADRLVRERGLSWSQVIEARAATLQPPRKPACAAEWRALAMWLRRNFSQHLNSREGQFVAQMTAWRGMPTLKQQTWLTTIAERFAAQVS
jgi:hypothetical protein